MGAYNRLFSYGLTNTNSEDLGVLCSDRPRPFYDYICYSFTCAGGNDSGKVVATSQTTVRNCPNCGIYVYPKPMNNKRRRDSNDNK